MNPLVRNLALMLAVLVSGCQSPGVIFPPVENAPQFPAPPEVTRISYVGQLATDADLKPGRNFFTTMGQSLFGKDEEHSMLTPFGICTDGKDRLFVSDSNAQVVHVFDLNSRQYFIWKPGEKRNFSQPVALAWDPAGRLLVADSVAGTILVFDGSGKLLAEWGKGILARPCGVAIDPASHRIFVVDTGAHQLVVLSSNGELERKVGQRGTGLGQFNFPTHVAIDHAGRVYVSDTLNFRVQQFSPDLKPIRQIGSKGDLPGYFSQPKAIAVDSQDHLYVIDSNFEAVQIFNSEGRLLMDFGEEGRGMAEFWLPGGIFIDAHDRIWIADSYNRRIQVFDYHAEAAEAKP
jgi:DNA-binding beta-propeller fold protein YncE